MRVRVRVRVGGVPEAREARRKKKAGRPKTRGAPSTAPSRSCRAEKKGTASAIARLSRSVPGEGEG